MRLTLNPLLAGALVMSSVAALNAQALKYPPAGITDHTDTYFGTQVHDPYRWMEDVDSPELKTWVDAENTLTQHFLADVPTREKIHARLVQLSNFERFTPPDQQNGRFFYRRNTGLQNQSVLLWQQGLNGNAKTLLDPNTLAADGTVALDTFSVTDDGTLIAYALEEAGSDLKKIHVKTVATGADLPDLVEWVKFSNASWLKDGSGFFYSSFGVPKTAAERAEALKHAAVFHKVYFHRLGTPQSADPIVFERPDDKEVLLNAHVSHDGHWLFLSQGKGHTNSLAVRDLTKAGWQSPTAPLIQIASTDDATYIPVGTLGHDLWLSTTKDSPNTRIVKVDMLNPAHEKWQTVIPETANKLDSASLVAGSLILNYVVDAQNQVQLHDLTGKLLSKLTLPGIGSVQVETDQRASNETFLTFTNYTTPPAVYHLDAATAALTPWKPLKLVFNPADYETKQLFAPSKDGTRVPLFVTYKKGTKLDGHNPTILYGYGGFNISLGPAYSSARLAWLEMGGIYAEAILRGGGEYGEKWHEAGTKTHKQNVFDDFIGCAEFLIKNNYTSPARLAINGGSNGGLLVGAVELQRPDLFGAAIAQVGVMDMLRFDKFTIGYAWKSDYGSPSDSEAEFKAIYKFSPVHNVHPGTRYPPTLITTADHDDRVFPAHSFKFAAAMQSAAAQTTNANPVLIRVETRAGHGGGMPLSKQLDVTADMYAFLVKSLHMEGTPAPNDTINP